MKDAAKAMKAHMKEWEKRWGDMTQ